MRVMESCATEVIPPHQRQTCKACQRRDYFDFYVPDDVWAAVVPERLVNRVVCLPCFDQFAHERGVRYAQHIHTLHFVGDQASFTFQVEIAVHC